MNIENLDKLIAALEAVPDEKFNMLHIFSDEDGYSIDPPDAKQETCGTAACIAGWALWVSNRQAENAFDCCEQARDWLGLSGRLADCLFIPWVMNSHLDHPKLYPRTRAVVALKHLRETGRVAWGRASKVAS